MNKYSIAILITVLVTLPISYVLGQKQALSEAKVTYLDKLPKLWQIPVKGIHFTYRLEGVVTQNNPNLVLTSNGQQLNFLPVPKLNATLGHSLSTEDVPNWRTITVQDIQVNDRAIITYYQKPESGVNIPVALFVGR